MSAMSLNSTTGKASSSPAANVIIPKIQQNPLLLKQFTSALAESVSTSTKHSIFIQKFNDFLYMFPR